MSFQDFVIWLFSPSIQIAIVVMMVRRKLRDNFPVFFTYPETAFGGDFETKADYRDPYLQKLIADKGGSMIWPPIRYSYDTHNLDLPTPAPSPPTWMLTEAQCKSVVERKHLKSCRDLEYNWLGTDDQGRDVLTRLIYGFRISVLFGLVLTIVSSAIGVAAVNGFALLEQPLDETYKTLQLVIRHRRDLVLAQRDPGPAEP